MSPLYLRLWFSSEDRKVKSSEEVMVSLCINCIGTKMFMKLLRSQFRVVVISLLSMFLLGMAVAMNFHSVKCQTGVKL